jgi:hypothetical protein
MRNLDNLIYRAEKLNEAKIQYKLGIIYLEGDRVEPNMDEAIRWLERAADQGHEEAARALESLEGKPKELEVQMGDDDLQVKDYDEGTPPIMGTESQELPLLPWGDESSGPPIISKPEMTVEEIGRKLGSQLKGMFGKTPGASSYPGESGEEGEAEKKNPGCGATAWVVGVVLYVLVKSCSG